MDDFEDTLRSHIIGLLGRGEDHPYVDETRPGTYLVRWTLPRRTEQNKQAWERRLQQIERGLGRLPNTQVRTMGWGEAGNGPYWYVNFQVVDRTAKSKSRRAKAKVLKAAKAYGVKKSQLAGVMDDLYAVQISAGSWARIAKEQVNRNKRINEVFNLDTVAFIRKLTSMIANQAQNIPMDNPRFKQGVMVILNQLTSNTRNIERAVRNGRAMAYEAGEWFSVLESSAEALRTALKHIDRRRAS